MDDLVWTCKEAALRLKISARQLFNLTEAGEVDAIYIGRRKLYRDRDLRAYVDAAPTSRVPRRSPTAKSA